MEATNQEEETKTPAISKRQLKKQLKQQQWEAKRDVIKAKKKEKKQKSKTCHAHLLRFKEYQREGEEAQPGKLSKKEKQELFKGLC
jgi:hypothetical protein